MWGGGGQCNNFQERTIKEEEEEDEGEGWRRRRLRKFKLNTRRWVGGCLSLCDHGHLECGHGPDSEMWTNLRLWKGVQVGTVYQLYYLCIYITVHPIHLSISDGVRIHAQRQFETLEWGAGRDCEHYPYYLMYYRLHFLYYLLYYNGVRIHAQIHTHTQCAATHSCTQSHAQTSMPPSHTHTATNTHTHTHTHAHTAMGPHVLRTRFV